MPDQAAHDRLRDALLEACAEHDIQIEVSQPPGPLQWRFSGQENAEAGLMAGVFQEELHKAGLAKGADLDPSAMDGATVAQTEQALRHSVARLRTLLIEHNSWLSGGLRWPFPDAAPAMADRGLAIYRFPATAEVDVVAEDDHIGISFQASELDSTVSSGFFVPTRLRGDFEATVRYQLGVFEPGAEAACFALFAQDEDSLLRYYAQRRAARGGRSEVLANFNNTVLTEPRAVTEPRGAFRLRRRGDAITSWHRGGADWEQIGEHRGDPVRDMIVGCKIWTTCAAGALEARLFELCIGGEIPDDQIDPVPVRPDPRFV